jgi:hypothetical protein
VNPGISFLMVESQPFAADSAGIRVLRDCVFFTLSFQRQSHGTHQMKLAGFLLLVSGWGIVVATLPLLPSLPARAAFALAGMAVELIGLALAGRGHWVQKEL